MGTVVAFAGAIGSGKTALSKRVAELLHWPFVSFGDYIREVARQNGQDQKDRSVLQKLGQSLVMTDVDRFVSAVLDSVDWRKEGNLIVDGLRHVEVRLVLLKNYPQSSFKLCPSSDDLRQFGCFRKGGSGSSVVEIKRHAGDAANDDLRWSGV